MKFTTFSFNYNYTTNPVSRVITVLKCTLEIKVSYYTALFTIHVSQTWFTFSLFSTLIIYFKDKSLKFASSAAQS